MKKMILKLGFLAFILFFTTAFLGERLNPLWSLFGDVETVKSYVVTGAGIAIFASLAMVIVRTIIGILFILFLAVLLFILLKTNLFNMLLSGIH